jgi:type VI secretion system secreted protein Hcp
MILLQLEGINGDSTIDQHANWISIDSVQFGVGRGISTAGAGVDRDTSTPSFSEVTMSKPTDIASTQLFAQAMYGKKIGAKATLKWLQTGGADAAQNYMTLELTDPIISSYSASSGGDRPNESFSINFSKIVFKYTQFKTGGEATPADPKGFDLMTGKPFAG